jgi:hypothetical protein
MAAVLLLAAALTAAACGASSNPPNAAAPHTGASSSGGSGMDDMANMAAPTSAAVSAAAPTGNGLASSFGGYVYLPSTDSAPADSPSTFTFHITGPDDHALTRYQPYESKLVVFYLIRSDLTGYRELDPTMREDGTWTVALPALPPGSYRSYVTFAAPDSSQGTPLLYALSKPLTVAGHAATALLPSPSPTTATDGYTLTLAGTLKAGASVPLSVGITSGGKPVAYFQRYLDGYAHLTAFHVGDGAFAHVLSTGRSGGQNGNGPLTARTLFPESGTWRLFVQFETGSKMHTAAFTVNVS